MPRGFVISGGDDDNDPFTAIMRGMMSGNGGGEERGLADEVFRPKINEEAAAMRLIEAWGLYQKKNEFVPGDLITPRKGFATKAPGTPCIVVDVRDNATFNFNLDGSSGCYGEKEDIRVLRFMRHPQTGEEMIVSFWVESWQYEYHRLSDKFSSAE